MDKDHHLLALLEILKSGYWYHKKVTEVLKPFGISHEQYNVLRILEHSYPRPFSLKEIQKRLMNQTANTTRLVEKLRQKGFLVSSYSTKNRRMLEIQLTGEGQLLLQSIQQPLFAMNDEVKVKLNDQEASKLVELLREIRK